MALRSQNPFQFSPIVAVLGGNAADEGHKCFSEAFGCAVEAESRFRICVSGFKGNFDHKDRTKFYPSFGFLVSSAAAVKMADENISRRIMTRYIKFEPQNHTQFAIGDSSRARGRNETSRGLSIISESDEVCLAGGGSGTEKYFEFARALDRPVLPLPFLGGAGAALWEKNQDMLCEEFGTEIRDLLDYDGEPLEKKSLGEIQQLASNAAMAVRICARLRCLVFMPFSTQFNWVFENIIMPACTLVGADAIRLDLEARAGDIVASFERELKHADCCIAVVSDTSVNVFYEIGYAHAVQLPVILLAEDMLSGDANNDLAFYLRNHRKVWFLPKENPRGEAIAIDELTRLLSTVRKSIDLVK